MVAVIKTGYSILRLLNYNENKVKEGVAQCISASNYPMDVEKLSFTYKLNRLINQVALNENVRRNSVHISLNFDPSEKLSNERLQEIADIYMNKIGFGEQPYLVYRHFDSGHPHIHVVSVKVRADGRRIETQNIGRNQSEKARKEIEQSFGLKKAENSKQQQHLHRLNPVNVGKIQYGRTDTRRAITNVLDAVLRDYKYTSIPELNAILKQYNVIADRGSENSRVYQNHGLVYRILDEQGNKIGVPIKASDIYNKPTLKYLEEKFASNAAARQPHKARIKNAIDLAFLKQPSLQLQNLIKSLDKEGITTVVRQNEDGLIYGLTYVDHRTKCVFNGSALGKQYSAKGMQERCGKTEEQPSQKPEIVKQIHWQTPVGQEKFEPDLPAQKDEILDLLDTLLQPEYTSGFVPYQLTRKGRRKKKRRGSRPQ